MIKKQKRARLGPSDWIDAAIERLIKRGVDAVRIEPLADSMGVTRGSFYWHFGGRQDLLKAILENWREYQTRRIVERIQRDAGLSPMERVTRLRMLPPRTKTSQEAAALELAIRAWALRDKLARRMVDEVDAERTKFTGSLLVDAGMQRSDADYWSVLSYAYTLGESLLRAHMSDREIQECRSRLLAMQAQLLERTAQPAKRRKTG
jgi:AcrR family transcriptional regulator